MRCQALPATDYEESGKGIHQERILSAIIWFQHCKYLGTLLFFLTDIPKYFRLAES